MSEHTRQKAIKKVLRQRKALNFLYKLSGHGASAPAKEVMLETEAGTVRTLWYGFNNKRVTPVFFGMHGGGFILMNAEADNAMNTTICKTLACKVVSIDYSLAPERPFPVAVDEVYAVVKEVHKNAERHGVNPQRMAIGRHSAGGNLATATCIQANRKKEFRFACQVLDYPPLDLATSPFDKPFPKGAIKPQTAAIYDACYIAPQQAKNPLASPVYASGEDVKGMPPALVILAGHDSLHDEGAKYAELLKQAGAEVELHDFPEEKHGFTYFRSKAVPEAMKLITDFLNKHLFSTV